MKKLFLLDAMALIYRAHFAFAKAPRITSKGMNTSAVFGFMNTLLEVLNKEKPTHIGVGFDLPGPTFRHVQYNQYKAQRQEQPEDITVAIPYVKKLVEAMNIPLLSLQGFEADDVIGTIAKKAGRAGNFEVYMMTPDKDYGQLVEEHIYLYKPAFMGKDVEIMGIPQVCERWGIADVNQVIDLLGLMGDAVDNIPGLPGVGEKTAVKLINEYGSVENIIANADNLKGKLAETVRNNADKAILSKELATIDINVPVEFNEESLKISEYNKEKLAALLDELEFKTLRKRLLGEESSVSSNQQSVTSNQLGGVSSNRSKKTVIDNQISLFETSTTTNQPAITEFVEEVIEKTPTSKDTVFSKIHEYNAVNTPELRKSLIHYLNLQDEFCFDTETTDVEATNAEIVGLSFCYRKGEAFYVPISSNQERAKQVLEEFRGVFENEKIGKIGQNIKYDLIILRNYGIEVKGELYDTMLAHYILEPEMRHGMDYLANVYLNYEPIHIEELIGKKRDAVRGKLQGNMRDVSLEKITDYAAEDADITFQLKEVLHKKLLEKDNGGKQIKLLETVEMPLVNVLANMEIEGVKVDITALNDMSKVLEEDIKVIQTAIFSLAGEEFNIASPKQLGDILFDKLKLDKNAKKTKTGQYMTGEEILSKLETEHEIVRKILDFRELVKLKNTYVDALPLLISEKTGRIHTSYNQAVASTGRLSSTNPNLQNIPIRTVRGREIRKAFIPRNEDFVILSADYSQIELRIMAAFSGDESMMEAFNQGRDIHATTASKVFKVSLDEVTSDMRRKAKMVNFGIIYGISAFGLAQRLSIPRSEAKEIIDNYWLEFPKVKTFMDECINKAREQEFVETILGRRRYLRDINSRNMTDRGFAERNAINAPIQGSAADIIKVAMIEIDKFIKENNLKSRMLLQVHDELIFDAHHTEIAFLKENVNNLMVNAIPLAVKMETGIGIGNNWLEAH